MNTVLYRHPKSPNHEVPVAWPFFRAANATYTVHVYRQLCIIIFCCQALLQYYMPVPTSACG